MPMPPGLHSAKVHRAVWGAAIGSSVCIQLCRCCAPQVITLIQRIMASVHGSTFTMRRGDLAGTSHTSIIAFLLATFNGGPDPAMRDVNGKQEKTQFDSVSNSVS